MPLIIPTLEGRRVRLEPLRMSILPELLLAATRDRSSFGLTDVPADESAMRSYVEHAVSGHGQGTVVPFATLDRATSTVVGSTRFGNIEYWAWPAESPHQRGAEVPDAVEIGWTWLTPDAQRTGLNREAKLLMLSYAFEEWRVHRVTLKTDARNAQSRQAIERLGAHPDGVLRAHQPASDGAIRDSAMYSILDSEWPDVKARILASLVR